MNASVPRAAGARRAQPGSWRRGTQRSKSAAEVPGGGRDGPKHRARDGFRGGTSPRLTVVGVVLAGGAGSRLGRSKAGLRLPGGPAGESGPTLVEWATNRLAASPPINEVLVAGGGTAIEPSANVRTTSVTAVEDGPGSGPAAGVLGAARARSGSSLLVLACDLPLAPTRLLSTLASSGADLAAAAGDVSDRWTMNLTCALWTPPALSVLATRVAAGDFRLYPLTGCSRLSIEPVAAARFGNPDDVLLNVNTADDWDRARRLFDLAGLRPAAT